MGYGRDSREEFDPGSFNGDSERILQMKLLEAQACFDELADMFYGQKKYDVERIEELMEAGLWALDLNLPGTELAIEEKKPNWLKDAVTQLTQITQTI